MRFTHSTLLRSALFAASVFCTGNSFAQAPQPAITLLKPASPNVDALARAAAKIPGDPAAIGYREFTHAKVGVQSAVETFTFSFHATTKVTAIAATGDFRITGSGCIEGHTYAAG